MSKKSYNELQIELEKIVESLQSEDVDLDDAIELHKKGSELIAQMQKILNEAEIKIKKLQ
ncbi:MAG: exodeoxyribonuclease VII small subunit [bacterium]|nr:exodeoxyribonuclease VII small subunit [bacterium]